MHLGRFHCLPCLDLIFSGAAPPPSTRTQRGVTSPEIVAATTAHAAIDKACSLMDIRLVKVSASSRRS